jgi:dUTP pyrophosphatase
MFLSPRFNQLLFTKRLGHYGRFVLKVNCVCYAAMSNLLLQPSSVLVAELYANSPKSVTENAGYDLFVPEEVVFAAGEKKQVNMGVRVMVEEGGKPQHYWMVPRSSISKTGLMMLNSVGVIDRGYRGELIAALWNTSTEPVTVSRGQRLVQIVGRDMCDFSSVKMVDSLPESVRGEGGFGSTGR